jgi:hypothetical protein
MAIPFPPYLPLILLLDFPQVGTLASRVVPARIRIALTDRLHRAQAALARFASRLRTSRPLSAPPLRAIWPAALAGSLLLSGQMLTGTLHISTWPISVFPTFAGRVSTGPRFGSDIRIEYQAQDGTTRDLRKLLKRMGPARLKNLFKKLTRRRDDRTKRALLELFAYAGRFEVEPGDHVAIIRARWDLYPLGKKANYKETLDYRYEVTENGGLSLVYTAGKDELPRGAKSEPQDDDAKSPEGEDSSRETSKKKRDGDEELDE